jgi:hypothetical protein
MALAFVLSLVALSSLLIVVTLPNRALGFSVDLPRKRSFKGHAVASVLKVEKVPRGGVPKLVLEAVPEGVEAGLEGSGSTYTLSVSSKFAGAFSGVKVKVGIGDPLDVFNRYEVRAVETVFEFLPTVLVQVREPMLVSAAMLGDYPAGRTGYGQEFYSAEEYTLSHSSKDIMWKRLAKSSDETPLARVGEANIPESVTAYFIEQRGAAKRRNPSWMNLASEAVARVGVPVVLIGSTLRLVHTLGDRTTVTEARSVPELADAVMSLWKDDAHARPHAQGPEHADIVVVGQDELASEETAALIARKPAVVLSWGQSKVAVGPGIVNFTGDEDISRLVVGVLSR